MEIRALGPVEILAEGVSVPLGGPKPTLLLATLLVDSGRVVSSDRLALALWGDDLPRSASHALHVHVSNLRKALEGTSVEIDTLGGGYRLTFDPDTFDVHRFEEAIRFAEAEPARVAEALRQGLALWRGHPFGSLGDEEPFRVEAQRLEQLRSAALEMLYEAELEQGNHARVVAEIEEELAHHPLRERLWQLLMLALFRSGRQAEALRAFARLRRLLGEELGIEPSSESRELERRILLQDPDLESPRRVAGNLPGPLTSTVGRDEELALVLAALDDHRIVTVHGAPGVGKSHLALVAASRSAMEAIWYLDVAESDDPDLLVARLARSIGIDRGEADPVGAIAGLIGDRRALLVLDGCERLASECADLAQELLVRCRRLTVLVTSLVVVGARGEFVVPLSPLPDGDASRLFLERARAVDARFSPGEDDSRFIAEICRRLDGLPLAVELAAARIDVLDPAQILERLDDRLLRPSIGSDEGRRALDVAITWSLGLLPDAVGSSHALLSVFRDGFDLDGAEHVLAHDSALDHLSLLVRHSLLSTERRAGEMRYRMLDAIRQHGLRRLEESGDLRRARDDHAAYVREWTSRAGRGLDGSDQLDWLVRFDSNNGNVRAALGHLLETGAEGEALDVVADAAWFWFLRTQLEEGWYWLERVLGATSAHRSIGRARALIRASQFAWEQGSNQRARAWLEEASEIAEGERSEIHVAWADAHLAMLDMIEGDDTSAVRRATAAKATFEARGSLAGAGFAIFVQAMAPLLPAWRSGTLRDAAVDDAYEGLHRLAAMARELGERNLIGHVEWALGLLAATGGDAKVSAGHLEQAARNLIELGNLSCLCHVLDGWALTHAEAGSPEAAARLLGMVARLRERTGTTGHDFERALNARAAATIDEMIGPDRGRALKDEGAATPLDEILSSAWSGD